MLEKGGSHLSQKGCKGVFIENHIKCRLKVKGEKKSGQNGHFSTLHLSIFLTLMIQRLSLWMGGDRDEGGQSGHFSTSCYLLHLLVMICNLSVS